MKYHKITKKPKTTVQHTFTKATKMETQKKKNINTTERNQKEMKGIQKNTIKQINSDIFPQLFVPYKMNL